MWAAARLIGTAKEMTPSRFLMPVIMFLLLTEHLDLLSDPPDQRVVLLGGLALIGVHVHYGSFFRNHLSQFQRLFLLNVLGTGRFVVFDHLLSYGRAHGRSFAHTRVFALCQRGLQHGSKLLNLIVRTR